MKTDDLILIEHPAFEDWPVIARVVSTTASRVKLVYYHPREGWRDEEKLRSTKHVNGILPADTDVANLQKHLNDAREKREGVIAAAKSAHRAFIKSLVKP